MIDLRRGMLPALGIISLLMAGCGGKGEKPADTAPLVKGLAFTEARTASIQDGIEASGTVKAKNSAVLAARVAGTVQAVHVREGDRVGRGKLLLTLDAMEGQAGAAGAKAGEEEARRGLDEAMARKRLADATFERYQKLYQEQAVTRQEFDTRQAEREVASQTVLRGEARLRQAREAARAAGAVAGYSRVTSPLAGVVTARPVDVGATVFPGTPMVTVEEEGNYRLEAAAPESLAGKVKVGDKVTVAIDNVPAVTGGRVAEVVPTADPLSRTFTVKIDIAAKGVHSGMFGRALFPVGERKGILVPKGAVVERGMLSQLFVVDAEKRLRLRLVKTGKTVGDRVEIISGLSDGERVVSGGVERAVDGGRIE